MRVLCSRILLFITPFLFNCKKKQETSPVVVTAPSNNTPPTGDYGVFSSSYNITELGNSNLLIDSTVNASFYASPSSGHSQISAGIVSVNNSTLVESTNPIAYSQTNGINIKTLNWQISGNSTITASSFSYVPSYPQYQASNLLPDTVTKSVGFSFTIDGIANTNKPVLISIDQGGPSISRTVTTFPSVITINSSEISNFLPNYNFIIRLSMFNYSNVSLNNNQYAINANRSFKKYCYLK